MELIISLLLFAVLSAACVTIFMKAHTMSEEAVLLSRGTDGLSSLAELIRGCDSPGEMTAAIAAEYPHAEAETAEAEGKRYLSFRICLDEDGVSCDEEKAAVLLTVDGTLADSVLEAELLCREASGRGAFAGDVICQLSVVRYYPPHAENEASKSTGGQDT